MNINVIYQNLLQKIMNDGEVIKGRNGTTKRIIGETLRFTSCPLISIRKTAWKSALYEMEWFLSGSNNLSDLHESVRKWWEPWANSSGIVNFNYGYQFTRYEGWLNQIELLINGLKEHPNSRRNLITTWNTTDMIHPECKITNCHGTVIQCWVDSKMRLTILMYERSVDSICGLPHNLIQYYSLCQYLVSKCGFAGIKEFIWIGGDIHIYEQHNELVKRIINEPFGKDWQFDLIYTPTSDKFQANDFHVEPVYRSIIQDKAEMIV